MDKNTIWAIVLSTLVIVASYLLLPRFFGKKTAEAPAAVEITAEDTQTNQAEILTDTMFDEETTALLSEVISYIDCAAKDNVIHKNCANRKKATLSKLLDDAKKSA